MEYFLAKTDPDTYSIQDLEKDKETVWDGVHNFQAINVIKSMKFGDKMLIYHSGGESAIVGIATIVSDPRKNEKDPRQSWVVDVRFEKIFEKPVTLKEIKESGMFNDWKLVSQGRLSTMPVPKDFLDWIH